MSVLTPLYDLYEWYISRNLNKENMPKHVAIIWMVIGDMRDFRVI